MEKNACYLHVCSSEAKHFLKVKDDVVRIMYVNEW